LHRRLAGEHRVGEAVKALIQHGASHSSRTERGDTPLNVACIRGETDVAGVLIRAGAKIGFGL
jgi:ankyrin repeat protein